MNNIEKTIEIFSEGQTKKKMADQIEKMCTCDGGASLSSSDHDKKCPAYKKLKEENY